MSAVPELNVLEAQIDDGLGQLIAEGEARMAELQQRQSEIERLIREQSRKLRTWENARRSFGAGSKHLRVVSMRQPSKREAVLAFLGEFPDDEFKLIEIRHALIERGWMTNEQAHALEVAVTEMEKRGEIRRVRKGIYTLRPRVGEAGDQD